jgi:hypothetical protein
MTLIMNFILKYSKYFRDIRWERSQNHFHCQSAISDKNLKTATMRRMMQLSTQLKEDEDLSPVGKS